VTTGSGSILEGWLMLLAGIAFVACVWTVRRQHLRWPGARTGRVTRLSQAQEEDERELRVGLVDLCERVDDSLNRLESQSEVRISRLEQLLAAADERINGLGRLQQDASAQAVVGPRNDRSADSPAAGLTAEASASTAALESEPPAVSSRTKRIHEMADEGLPAIKIAEAVAVPLGEVELVLNLRRFGVG
jgi:hypothetical protein